MVILNEEARLSAGLFCGNAPQEIENIGLHRFKISGKKMRLYPLSLAARLLWVSEDRARAFAPDVGVVIKIDTGELLFCAENVDNLVSVKDAATALRVTPTQIHRLIRGGELRAAWGGKRTLRVYKNDVDKRKSTG